MQNLFKKSGYDLSVKELDLLNASAECFEKNNHYMLLDYNTDEIMSIKNNMASNDYKIINKEEALQIIEKEKSIVDKINEIITSKDDSDREKEFFIGTILYILHRGIFKEEFVTKLMNDNDFNISKIEKKELFEFINSIKNDVPIWLYKGYSKKEKNKLPSKKKIGRNELCCGSGKKYKNCCGK